MISTSTFSEIGNKNKNNGFGVCPGPFCWTWVHLKGSVICKIALYWKVLRGNALMVPFCSVRTKSYCVNGPSWPFWQESWEELLEIWNSCLSALNLPPFYWFVKLADLLIDYCVDLVFFWWAWWFFVLPSLLEGPLLFLFIMSRNSRKFNLSFPVHMESHRMLSIS